MIEFFYHDGIQKEIAVLKRRFRNIQDGLKTFEKLCEVQFNPIDPKQIITSGKLHRITQNDIWTLWKIELIIPNSGLRPNQYPRMWFVVSGSKIVFLCIYSHIDNYQDGKINNLALSRITDFF